ncbi:MAG: hypothetical protein RIQ89_466 [Bacteroidota bacterium]
MRSYFFCFLFFAMQFSLQAQQWQQLGPFQLPVNAGGGSATGIGRAGAIKSYPHGQYLCSPFGGLFFRPSIAEEWKPLGYTGLQNACIADVVSVTPDLLVAASGDPDAELDKNAPALGSTAAQWHGNYYSLDAGQSWHQSQYYYDLDKKLIPNLYTFPSKSIVRNLIAIQDSQQIALYCARYTYNHDSAQFVSSIFTSLDSGKSWYMTLSLANEAIKTLHLSPHQGSLFLMAGQAVYAIDHHFPLRAVLYTGLPHPSFCARIVVATSATGIYALVVNDSTRQNELYYCHYARQHFQYLLSAPRSPTWRTALAPTNDTIFFTSGNHVHAAYYHQAKWQSVNVQQKIHDDVHELYFDTLTQLLYASTDGGLYRSDNNGRSWLFDNGGANIAQVWSVAANKKFIIAGLQDAGTIVFQNNKWKCVAGGDGMRVAIHPRADSIAFRNDGQNNITAISTNNGTSWKNIHPRSQVGAYVKPFFINQQQPNAIYAGFTDLFYSPYRGQSWLSLGAILPSTKEKLISVTQSIVDSNVIVAAYPNPTYGALSNKLFLTTNHGRTWIDRTPGLLGVAYSSITSTAIHPTQSTTIYVSFYGGWVYKVMASFDSGNNWHNLEGLPSFVDVYHLLTFKHGRRTYLLAATSAGVYAYNQQQWYCITNGMLPVVISELYYSAINKTIYAATHGSGIWQLPIRKIKFKNQWMLNSKKNS